MKATGIVRSLDPLNRIVIPMEIVKTQNLQEAPMEIFTDEDGRIILRKYQPGCVFCGETQHLWEHKGKWVCTKCTDTLALCATPKEVKVNAEPRKSKKA